jgi:hypothetical protein
MCVGTYAPTHIPSSVLFKMIERYLFFYFKDLWDGMAFPATDMRIKPRTLCFLAISRYLNALLKDRRQRAGHIGAQAHEFTRISPVNGWYRAGLAQHRRPGRSKQATFLVIAPAVIIPIKILAF